MTPMERLMENLGKVAGDQRAWRQSQLNISYLLQSDGDVRARRALARRKLDVRDLGALHGAALVAHRIWRNAGFNLPKPLAWLLTFLFVNVTWVLFRAKSMDDAMRFLRGMVSLEPAALPTAKLAWGGWLSDIMLRSLPAELRQTFCAGWRSALPSC